MERAKAILFDFDGVLAKTMEDNFNAWRLTMEEYAIRIQPNDYYPLEGLKVAEVAATFFKRSHRPLENPAEVVRKKEAYYLKNHKFEFYPGVADFLNELQVLNIPMAMVTAALKSRLEKTCSAQFLERFNALVTGDDSTEGKPSPAPYLRAASKLGFSAHECIVVENAPLGIKSAKSAGSYCIALATTMEKKYLQEADEILTSFLDLKRSDKIRQLLK